MAKSNTQDVELRIRATNLSKQTTDKVVASLKDLTKAQEEQIEASKKGLATAAQLEAGYNKIEDAARSLVSQGGLIKLFEAQSKAAADASARLEAARKALTDYSNSLDPAVSKTRAQEAELKALAKAVTGAEKGFANMQTRVGQTAERLEAFGINTANVAESQQKINTAVTAANVALERQEAALGGLETRQRRLKALEDARAGREQQLKVDQAFTKAQQDHAKALEADAAAQRAATQAYNDANRERQVAVDVAFAAAQRDATEAANKRTAAIIAQNAALRAAADAAERQMRATGAGARGAAPISTSNVAGTIRDIGDPAAAAIRTVNGLEAAVAGLETRVSALNGPVQDFKGALREATAAQQALIRVAGQVDAYNNQIAALRAARAEYVAARTAVAQLIAEMRSGAAGEDVTTRLRQAQSTLAAASAQFRNLATATRASRDALTATGIDTRNLAAAEGTLVEQARRATSAVNTLTTAYNQNGDAAAGAARATNGWLTGGRDTMSLATRLKGELIGLATAYVGLNASINLAQSSLETYNKFQALQSRLLVAAKGDQRAAADEFAYLTQVSEKFGFVLLDIGAAYAKFGIAAKASNFTTQETRYVFENFAKAARNARLSTAEFEGILKAVEQIMSKGTVQAEELRGQLGDRLPGAFVIAAQAAGKTTAEYSKMLELGQVSSDRIIEIARGVGETYGAIATSADTLNVAQARFQNSTDRFKNAIAEKGFADAYRDFLNKLSDIMSGSQGDELASNIAKAFKGIIDVIVLLIENIDTVVLAIKVLLGLKVVAWAFEAASALGLLRTAFIALNAQIYATMGTGIVRFLAAIGVGATGAAGGIGILTAGLGLARAALMALARAVPYLAAALVVFEIAKFAWDKFFNKEDAIKAGEEAGKAGARAAGKAAADTPAPPPRDNSFNVYAQTLGDRDKDLAKLEQQRLDILKEGAKNDLAARLKYVNQSYDAERAAAVAAIKDKTALELRLADIQEKSDREQANERLRYRNEQSKSDETAGKRRERLALEVSTKLKEIEDDLAKRAAAQDRGASFEDRREARVVAIGHAYDDLSKKIVEQAKLDPKAATAARERLNLLIQQRQAEERITATREEAVTLEKEFVSLQEIQKSQIDAINTKRESGQISAQAALEQTNAVIAETGPALEEAGNKALTFANSVRSMLDPVVFQRLIATIGQGMAKANVDATMSMNNLNATQEQLNQTLARQAEAIDMITLKRKLGMITSEQEATELNKNTLAYKASVDDLTKSLLQQLEIARAFGAISEEAYAKAKAGVDQLVVSTDNAAVASTQLEETITGSLTNNALTAFEALGNELGKVVAGTESLGEGFKAAASIAGQFFAGLLRDIALAIAKQLILNAIASMFGAGSGIGAGAIKLGGVVAGGQHTGGITGRNASFKRRVDESYFYGAPKYHNGGLAGLQPNEVPAILERNEEVLTRDDPRHVLNGGGSQAGTGVRVVVVDDRTKVAEAMQSAEGEKVILQQIRRNIATVKQWVK